MVAPHDDPKDGQMPKKVDFELRTPTLVNSSNTSDLRSQAALQQQGILTASWISGRPASILTVCMARGRTTRLI